MNDPHRISRPLGRIAWLEALVLGAALCVVACGPGDTVEIATTRVVRAGADPVIPGATSGERFAPRSDHAGHAHEEESETHSSVTWDVPEGWASLPTDGVGLARFRVGGDDRAECSVTSLAGSGGGLAANVNRWRAQLGLGPIAEHAVAALPRVPMLGTMATLVELRQEPPESPGPSVPAGEGSAEGKSGALLGLIVPVEAATLFIKLTGPMEVVASEAGAFEAFCGSLRLGHGAAEESRTASSASWTYTLPDGWQDAGPREMREVNLRIGQETECYVVLLAGEAGGLVPNLNRWRGEVGLAPIGEAQAEALERIALLGQPCPLLEVSAPAAEAEEARAGERTLMGTMLIRSSRSVFVKMVGPRAEVSEHRQAFKDFCASLREAR